MGVIVNPVFENVARILIEKSMELQNAQANYELAISSGDETKIREAETTLQKVEQERHEAEPIFCKAPRTTEDSYSDMTRAEAEEKVDKLMKEVGRFYT